MGKQRYIEIELELPQETIQYLEEESKRLEISIDELVNQILENYINKLELIK